MVYEIEHDQHDEQVMSFAYMNETIMRTAADGIVNPVNCMGTMGKGLARRMADKWPCIESPYKGACASRRLVPGSVMAVELWPQRGDAQVLWTDSGRAHVISSTRDLPNPRWMILFPTKDHWRHPSRLEWIKNGLGALQKAAAVLELQSVAIPALGCGLGGLSWEKIRPVLEGWAAAVPFEIHLYTPTK